MADVGDVSFVPLLFVFVAHLFVLPGVSSKICAPVDHDIAVLKDQPFWYFEQDHNVSTCLPFQPRELNVTSTCIFYFSICQPVPRYCPGDTGICLANKVSFSPKYKETLYSQFWSIGRFNDEFKSEANFFTLKFGPGDLIDPLLIPATELKFQCDEKAIWNKTADGRVPFPPSITIKDFGQYVMVFNYSGACYGGGGGGGGKGGGEPARALSVGSIMLILFFPGLFLYCVVGALINKGAGKSGKELMPHSKFWSNLPGLISDGFSFTIAKITCTEMSSTRETYNPM